MIEQHQSTSQPIINKGALFVLLKLGIGIAGVAIYMAIWRIVS